MQFLPLFLAMPRRCRVCGAEYLGGSVCSDRNCRRNGRRQRNITLDRQMDDIEAPPLVSLSPRPGADAEDVAEPPAPPPPEPPIEQELAELRGLLHELLEVSMRIWRRCGPRALRWGRLGLAGHSSHRGPLCQQRGLWQQAGCPSACCLQSIQIKWWEMFKHVVS